MTFFFRNWIFSFGF